MTHKEVDIIQKLGSSSFSIYSYLKEFPRSSNTDLQINLAISMPTIRKSFQKLEDCNVVKRVIKKNNTREVIINSEENWKIQ